MKTIRVGAADVSAPADAAIRALKRGERGRLRLINGINSWSDRSLVESPDGRRVLQSVSPLKLSQQPALGCRLNLRQRERGGSRCLDCAGSSCKVSFCFSLALQSWWLLYNQRETFLIDDVALYHATRTKERDSPARNT